MCLSEKITLLVVRAVACTEPWPASQSVLLLSCSIFILPEFSTNVRLFWFRIASHSTSVSLRRKSQASFLSQK